MSKVFKYADPTVQELKQFRQVCSLWYTASLDIWRSLAVVKLEEPDDATQEKFNQVSARELCRLAYEDDNSGLWELSKKPFNKYKIKGWAITCKRSSASWQNWLESWRNYTSKTVKYLEIQNSYWSDSEHLEELLLNCKNLVDLTFVNCTYGMKRVLNFDRLGGEIPMLTKLKRFSISEDMPIQWGKFLAHVPMLEVRVSDKTLCSKYYLQN